MTMRLPRRAVDWLGRSLLAIGTRLASPVPAGEQCAVAGCEHRADACWLPDDSDEPSAFYCRQHAHEHGFCWGCGNFNAGCEAFDFDPHGLCDNCRSNPDFTGDYGSEEDDEYDYDDIP